MGVGVRADDVTAAVEIADVVIGADNRGDPITSVVMKKYPANLAFPARRHSHARLPAVVERQHDVTSAGLKSMSCTY